MNKMSKRGYTSKWTGLKGFILVLVTLIGAGSMIFVLSSRYISKSTPNDNLQQIEQNTEQPNLAQNSENNSVKPFDVTSIAKFVTPAVVGISVLEIDGNSIFNKNANEKWGVGSGIIVTADGFILTNYHVAGEPNKEMIVSIADGRNVNGVTVWADSVLDIAVVKVNLTSLPTATLGDANQVQVGELAIAIGNPLGLQFQRTVTSGIISALNRTVKIDTDQGSNYMEDLIQTDASINPGNSGGPLLNSQGQVIGINTIKVQSAEGIGFAVPVDVAVPIINHLKESNRFDEPYVGIFAYDKEIVPYLNNNNIKIDNGIYIVNVDKNGPAYESGLDVGCILTEVDGKPIDTMMHFRTYIYSKKPGDNISVKHFSKDGKSEKVQITLANKRDKKSLNR